jgi:hypothetical protein
MIKLHESTVLSLIIRDHKGRIVLLRSAWLNRYPNCLKVEKPAGLSDVKAVGNPVPNTVFVPNIEVDPNMIPGTWMFKRRP